MDLSRLIPTADAIPVPWGWFKFLLILTFVLHLLLMNLMLGGSLLAFVDRLRRREPSSESHGLPILVALTVNLGVPPLLFVQVLYGHFLYTSSVLMAIYWLSVIPILILAYYAAYGFVSRKQSASRAGTWWLGISALLMLAVGFVLSNNMTLMLRPERWTTYFAHPGGTVFNLSEPTLIPRYLHFVVAAIAVAGLGRAVYFAALKRPPDPRREVHIRGGLRIFGVATMIQIVVGILFWLLLPAEIGRLFLGGSLVHSIFMGAAILLGLAALLASFRRWLWPTVVLAAATVVTMVLVRDLVRTAYLAPHFSLKDLQMAPQTSPMVWFFIALVAVAAIMAYVLRRAWREAT